MQIFGRRNLRRAAVAARRSPSILPWSSGALRRFEFVTAPVNQDRACVRLLDPGSLVVLGTACLCQYERRNRCSALKHTVEDNESLSYVLEYVHPPYTSHFSSSFRIRCTDARQDSGQTLR